MVTKNINAQDPIVISVGKFLGGTKANIISKYTELEISMRYFSPEVRKIAHEGIRRHAQAIADAFELKAEVIIEESALSMYNDDELAKLAEQSAAKIFGEGKNVSLPRYMGSEDMPYYFQHAQGVYAFLGYKNEEKEAIYFPHHERFKIDEDYLKYGTALHVQFALDFLNS
jgi:metal-dependent amidase/aminoacylase/carboxypeptidase family protein